MISIQFNGETLELEQSVPMQELLSMNGYVQGSFAATLNRQFIPSSHYPNTMVNTGDVIDIITPMQGG